MVATSETRRAIREEFGDIANKWLRGREEIAALQGSSFVVAGDAGQSVAQRSMLNLMADVTRDMNRLLGDGLSPNVIDAMGEVFYMWKNATSHRDTIQLASTHVARNTVH